MAKQTTPKAAAKTPQNVENAEIISADFNVVQTQIISVKNAGDVPVLFRKDNTAELVQMFINSEIVHYEHSAETCAALVKQHSKKKVKDKDDAKGYEAVKAAYNELVKVRTSTETKRKDLGKPYASIKSGVDDFAKNNIIAVLADEEARLKIEKDKFEKWEQEEKDRLEKLAAENLKKRVDELKTAGLQFNGDLYFIGENINIDIVTIGKFSETDYAFFLAKVQEEQIKIDAAIQAEKDAEIAAAAKLKAEQDKAAEDAAENARKAQELIDEKLEVRRERFELAGFTDDVENKRFYTAGTGYFFELLYEDAANQSAADFKSYLESAAAKIAELKIAEEKAAEAAQAAKDAAPAPQPIAQEKTADKETTSEIKPMYVPTDASGVSTTPLETSDIDKIKVFVNAISELQEPELLTETGRELFGGFMAKFAAITTELFNETKFIKYE